MMCFVSDPQLREHATGAIIRLKLNPAPRMTKIKTTRTNIGTTRAIRANQDAYIGRDKGTVLMIIKG